MKYRLINKTYKKKHKRLRSFNSGGEDSLVTLELLFKSFIEELKK